MLPSSITQESTVIKLKFLLFSQSNFFCKNTDPYRTLRPLVEDSQAMAAISLFWTSWWNIQSKEVDTAEDVGKLDQNHVNANNEDDTNWLVIAKRLNNDH